MASSSCTLSCSNGDPGCNGLQRCSYGSPSAGGFYCTCEVSPFAVVGIVIGVIVGVIILIVIAILVYKRAQSYRQTGRFPTGLCFCCDPCITYCSSSSAHNVESDRHALAHASNNGFVRTGNYDLITQARAGPAYAPPVQQPVPYMSYPQQYPQQQYPQYPQYGNPYSQQHNPYPGMPMQMGAHMYPPQQQYGQPQYAEPVYSLPQQQEEAEDGATEDPSAPQNEGRLRLILS